MQVNGPPETRRTDIRLLYGARGLRGFGDGFLGRRTANRQGQVHGGKVDDRLQLSVLEDLEVSLRETSDEAAFAVQGSDRQLYIVDLGMEGWDGWLLSKTHAQRSRESDSRE